MSTNQLPPDEAPAGAIESEKLAYSIARLSDACDLGRTFIYEEIKAGRLQVIKAGRRTLIETAEARRWLSSLRRGTTPEAPCEQSDGKPAMSGAGGVP